jgi:hypothetical protein
MPDGRKAGPGGWNRIIIINVDDLRVEVARLRKAQLHFRNDLVSGPGGSEILLDDPSGFLKVLSLRCRTHLDSENRQRFISDFVRIVPSKKRIPDPPVRSIINQRISHCFTKASV